ncbi:ABC transporter G family member 41 [Carex littledalei]|uniref:ABC transporter G family member 41 n=1 Tax=Carex littledalei TaxID=544730 RepID=A0A833RZ52_9POAL|nr:ABC transporter G family member 41 [Carex littledalei]
MESSIGEGERKGEKQGRVPVDVGRLGAVERRHFIDSLINHIEEDNLRLLQKQRSRIDRVNVKQPTIEVRYKNLSVEAECEVVQGKPLPTLWNSLMSMISGVTKLPGLNYQQATIRILKDVSGVIKPGRQNEILVKQLSTPSPGSSNLRFKTRYPQKFWVQFKACLWKQSLSYWRSPRYTIIRMMFMFIISVILGLLFWKRGGKIINQQDLFNILGCMFLATFLVGIRNCSSTVSFISPERNVAYRENFAGMYSPWAYSFAQVAIEIPYVLFQVVPFMIIAYPAIGFEWNAGKFMYFFYTMFCTFLTMTYLGMMLMAMTPTVQLATILQTFFYQLFTIFSGFIIPRPQIPGWWVWMYYTCPWGWTLNALLTSQYGDVPKLIIIFGEEKSILQFLEDYFGFRHDRLPLVAVILALYPIAFATLFAFFIGRINFQKR